MILSEKCRPAQPTYQPKMKKWDNFANQAEIQYAGSFHASGSFNSAWTLTLVCRPFLQEVKVHTKLKLPDSPMTQRLEILYKHSPHRLLCACKISRQCRTFYFGQVSKSIKSCIFIAFLQYFAAYKQTSHLPRNLKFGMLSIHLLLSVYIKFHVNAPIFEGAIYKKVQKSHFYSILINLQITQRLEIQYEDTPPNRVCPSKISRQCCMFYRNQVQKSIFTAILQHFSKNSYIQSFERCSIVSEVFF